MAELTLKNISKRFGGLLAVDNLDLDVPKGMILSLIGPNGAGKTTVFNMITGVYLPSRGTIIYRGNELNHLRSNLIIRQGIARTFQNIRLFKSMTVLENVMVGRHNQTKTSWIASGLRLPHVRRKEEQIRSAAIEILEFIGLAGKAEESADTLPLGERKILEIGRALATEPELVCLDEPAAGLNETETQVAADLIQRIKDRGITVLLVEHDMKVVMNISDEIMVLNYGEKIAEGTPEEIQNNTKVIEAYLGGEEDYA